MPSPSQETPLRLLVVDDDITVLGLIEDVLSQEEDFTLETCHDSVRARDRLREADFDILITDLKMPKVDGVALLRELFELEKDTLVIVITGYATLESCLEAIRFGAYDYLTKPFRMDELLHVTRKAVDRVRLNQRRREVESALDDHRRELERLESDNRELRENVERLEEENAAFRQLLQRAGITPRGAAPARPGGRTGTYPFVAERTSDRVSRELERISQLEESGAITVEEAERARRKITASGEA